MKVMVKMLRMMLLMLVGLYGSLAAAAGAMVESPWVREAPPTAAALGAFMVLHNHNAMPLVLVGAECSAVGEVQLHRTVMEDGMAKMLHQPSIEIPAHGQLEFKPGDYHLMLMKPKYALKSGEKVAITLKFKDGSTLPVTFVVRAGMDMAMDHGSMHHGH
jgi:copper(I)-binding protein